MQARGGGRGRREGTAHGATVPLTVGVEAGLRLSKGACLSFVETETAGYRGQMQSSTTNGKLIALPPSDIQQSEKKKKKEQGEEEERERERERGDVVRGSLAFLLSSRH